MSRRGSKWIAALVVAVVLIGVGSLFLHKNHTETMQGDKKEINEITAYLEMMEQNSYPDMKETLERQVGVPVTAIYHTYVSYKEEGLQGEDSNQLEMSFYDVDRDGVKECLVANTIPTYEIGCVVLVYKFDKTAKLAGMLEMGTTHEEFTNQLSPFEQHKKGDSLLYANKKNGELYTCSYENGLLPKQINRAYHIEQGKVKQIAQEAFPMTDEGKLSRKASQFSEIGENIPFYSYEEIVAKYRNK